MGRNSWAFFWASFCSVLLLLFLSACGGGSKKAASVGPPATVALNPQPGVSLTAGDVLQMSVSVLDAQNRSVFNQPLTFNSDNPNQVQIASNGLLCAGTWQDANHQPSLTSPVNCIAPQATAIGAAGIAAHVSASAGGITSNMVAVSVHLQVTSVQVTPANPPCVTQGGTQQFTAKALNGTTDITASVGDINWQVLSGLVASAAPITTAGKIGGSDPTTVTAKLPGATQVLAVANTVNPVNSVPAVFTECPVASITLSPTPVSLANVGATQQLTATVVDTTGATLATLPTLTWTSKPSAVASVSTSGLVTAVAAGTGGVLASCNPSNCNLGLQRVFSDVLPVTVAGTSSTTVFAASSTSTNVVPISTSNNTALTAIALPSGQTPNSLVLSPTGSRAFLGSTAGLMAVDATNNTFVGTVTSAPGKVLAVSPDGSQVIISDTTAAQLRLFNGTGNTVTNFSVPGATAAEFSPDGSKAYIVAGSKLFVLQGAAITSVALSSSASGVSFLANGAVAYLADTNTSRVLTCNNAVVNGPGGAPLLVATLPNGKQMLATDNTNIDALDVTVTPAGGSSASACPVVNEARTSHSTGSTAMPAQLIVTPDSTKAFVTSSARTGSLLAYDVGANAAAGTASTIALAVGVGTTTGDVTLDSKTLYVGGTDNKVHVIDIANGTETTTIDLMTLTPDFVAVRPH